MGTESVGMVGMYESIDGSGRPVGWGEEGRIDGGNAEGGERQKNWFIVFDIDSNHQQCESRETVVNLFMQAVFTDDGG